MVEALVAAIPFDSAAVLHVMDSQMRHGAVAKSVLNAFPNAHVTCLGPAKNMILFQFS